MFFYGKGAAHSIGIWTLPPHPPSTVITHSPAGLGPPLSPLPVLVLLIYFLASDKWLDKVGETLLNQLQNVSKTFRPLYLVIYLPIHQYGRLQSGRNIFETFCNCLKNVSCTLSSHLPPPLWGGNPPPQGTAAAGWVYPPPLHRRRRGGGLPPPSANLRPSAAKCVFMKTGHPHMSVHTLNKDSYMRKVQSTNSIK